jgi:adhesin/invasin
MHRSTIAERHARARRGGNPLLAIAAACALSAVITACNVSDSTTPGANVSLSRSSGDSQTVLAGVQTAPLVVKVTDGGTPQAGVMVHWTTPNSGVTLSPDSSATDANGLAQTIFMSQKAATDTVRANTTTAIIGFIVKVVADSNTGALFAAGGNGSATLVGIGVTLTVKSADAFGNARPGITVNFAIDAGGGVLSKTTVTTDASGQATTTFTPGPTAGAYSVRATATNFTPITFSVSAI